MRQRRTPRHIEDSEQEALVDWFKVAYPAELLFAIPNQLVRSPYQGAAMYRRGLVPGMPDLMLAAVRKPYGGLFIELKRPKGWDYAAGEATVAQKDCLYRLNRLGYLAVICYGWDDARRAIVSYMEGES